mgnify:CR=1 FL=1
MEKLCIEWKHLEIDNGTCLRCSKTGKTLNQVVEDLKKELNSRGVEINFIETKLPEKQIQQSNIILINGKAIEEILSETKVGKNYCSSCSCLTGIEAYCRTIQYDDEIFEEIPGGLIRKAVFKILEMNNMRDYK